ncbi:MAG: polysaccharide deacetylase family protein [Myxococcales bacterium]|nr:MAG: polysaccharide deacetylase family protein [Myxococcales bacterium]
MQRLAAVSVDLDEIDCYHAIHGLKIDQKPTHPVYDYAIARLAQTFKELDIPATFFVIGRDLERDKNAETLRSLHKEGYELANHSFHHRYDFSKQSEDSIRDDVLRGQKAIEAVTGKIPRGFRAPGYTINNQVFRILEELGLEYDSSVFPCPWYYVAKHLALAWIKLRGRKSPSIADTPKVLFAPANPYRIGAPYWKRGNGLLELPIGVQSNARLRFPFIGTNVVLFGDKAAQSFAKGMRSRPFVNLELHGMDLLDAEQDDLGYLRPHQPDLRKTLAQKKSALVAAISQLKQDGCRFVTLNQAAEHFGSHITA